jgi:hypothetical protein
MEHPAQLLLSLFVKLTTAFREKDCVDHSYLQPILKLLDLHLISGDLGLEILVELLIRFVQIGVADFVELPACIITPGCTRQLTQGTK